MDTTGLSGIGRLKGQCPDGAVEYMVGWRLGLQPLSCGHILLSSYSKGLGLEGDPGLRGPQNSSMSDHHSQISNSH